MSNGCKNCENCEFRKKYLELKALVDSGQLVPASSQQVADGQSSITHSDRDWEDACYNGPHPGVSDRWPPHVNSRGLSIFMHDNLPPLAMPVGAFFLFNSSYLFNSSKNILFSIWGFAFPLVSFMACPTKNPNALSFPAL